MDKVITSKGQFMYGQALSNATLVNIEASKVLFWSKDQASEPTPDMLVIYGMWTKALDMLERLKELSDTQQYKVNEVSIQLGELTIDELELLLAEIDGTLKVCEEHNSDLFTQTINKQLVEGIKRWEEKINLIEFCDEEELTEILEERDLLEYSRMGINIIRLEYPRLKDVEYRAFAKALNATDSAFRKALKGKTYPLPYADQIFWWRK